MINLKFLNAAIGKVSTDEFALLYVIANNKKLQKEGRVRIYREQIADLLGWLNDERPEYGLKKVTKITNSLVEKGWLKKDVVFETPQKSVNFYTLCTQKIEQKLPTSAQKIDEKLGTSTQKNVPLNNTKKELKKTNKTNNTYKTEKSNELKYVCTSNDSEEEEVLPF